MIIYKCTIPASTDLRGPYEDQYVEIESEHAIPINRLRYLAITKLPKNYVSFGYVSHTVETEDV